ncbi:uncharacterized protein [Vicugna pacos]|uniref:Uncharacterized protein n=1 Tax=Vicugna pacos TaxID=30538 RepID=A0ABM5C8M9_VICPA
MAGAPRAPSSPDRTRSSPAAAGGGGGRGGCGGSRSASSSGPGSAAAAAARSPPPPLTPPSLRLERVRRSRGGRAGSARRRLHGPAAAPAARRAPQALALAPPSDRSGALQPRPAPPRAQTPSLPRASPEGALEERSELEALSQPSCRALSRPPPTLALELLPQGAAETYLEPISLECHGQTQRGKAGGEHSLACPRTPTASPTTLEKRGWKLVRQSRRWLLGGIKKAEAPRSRKVVPLEDD